MSGGRQEAEKRAKALWVERQAELNKAGIEQAERHKVLAEKAQEKVMEEAAARQARFEAKVSTTPNILLPTIPRALHGC